MNKDQKAKFTTLLTCTTPFKTYEVELILQLLEESLKPVAKAPRIRNTKAPALKNLFEWEAEKNCQLRWEMLREWVAGNGYDLTLIQKMIEEFRLEMIGKNKMYADFKATFQTYVNKGYLSLKPSQLKREPITDGVAFQNRGVRL